MHCVHYIHLLTTILEIRKGEESKKQKKECKKKKHKGEASPSTNLFSESKTLNRLKTNGGPVTEFILFYFDATLQ